MGEVALTGKPGVDKREASYTQGMGRGEADGERSGQKKKRID